MDVASQHFGTVDGDLKKDLRCMLEMNDSYIWSFVTIESICSQVCCRSLSVWSCLWLSAEQ